MKKKIDQYSRTRSDEKMVKKISRITHSNRVRGVRVKVKVIDIYT